MSTIALQASPTKIGDYLVLEKIGKGGMSTVYRGQHRHTGRQVAIKIVGQNIVADVELGMRFARECQVTRNLNHPNLVRVLDSGVDGSRAYMVMEYVDGESLGQRIERVGRLAESEVRPLITQVGLALNWAHRQRLIHRDVKPDNILLTRDGQAKLSDLGLVKNLESDIQITHDANILGTPNFMAPEQFEDAKQADPLSDLYSLAATMYMALTAQVPFGTGSTSALASMMKKKLTNNIPAACALVPEVSGRVSAAIATALRADPSERQHSLLEFLDAISGDQVAVAPEPAPGPANEDAGDDRRIAQRFPSQGGTSCQPLLSVADERWDGRVINISQTGFCIELARRFEPGSILTILIKGASVERRSLVVRVMWSKRSSPKTWQMGCKFDQPLCDAEVDSLRLPPDGGLYRRA